MRTTLPRGPRPAAPAPPLARRLPAAPVAAIAALDNLKASELARPEEGVLAHGAAVDAHEAGEAHWDRTMGVMGRSRTASREPVWEDVEREGPAPSLPRRSPAARRPSAGDPVRSVPRPKSRDLPGVRGAFARLWRAVTWPIRVFPDSERNRAYWDYVWGQALLQVGVSYHYTALPKLVDPASSHPGRMGINRAVNWGAQAAANLATGPAVNRADEVRMMSRTYRYRALLMGAVPVLFFAGQLSFPVFTAIIFAAGFLQSMGLAASSVAYNRILGREEASYNKANAVYNIVSGLAGFVAPLAAGSFIGLVNAQLGLLAGNALAYAVYAALAVLVGLWYETVLRLPRDPFVEAARDLDRGLRDKGWRRAGVRGVLGEVREGRETLVVEFSGRPQALAALPAAFRGRPVAAAAPRSQWRELGHGLEMIWKDRFLRLHHLFMIPLLLAGDALIFTAIPSRIDDMLKAGGGSDLSGVPILGPLLKGLMTDSGAFGIFLAASSLGLTVSTLAMMLWHKAKASTAAEAPREEPAGALTRLEREGRWTSIVHGIGMLSYLGVFLAGGLWGSAGFLLLSALLQGPCAVVWASISQKVLQDRHRENMGKVYSAMFFYQLALSIAGVLLFGLTGAPLWLVAGALIAVAAADFVEPFVVFPLRRALGGVRGPKP